MQTIEYRRILQFSEEWFDLGLLNENDLQELGRTYELSDDRNSEHYRYGVFRRYLAAHRPLPESMAETLYRLGEDDPDRAMGEAMMHSIVELPECPRVVERRAVESGVKHLVRSIGRKHLFVQIDSRITDDLVAECIAANDSVVQEHLVNASTITVSQLEKLAMEGGSKRIRYAAVERVRTSKRN